MSATITDEQCAARELVRSWAASVGAHAAAREIEQGTPDAWRPVYDGLAELGLFGVAVAEDAGGAGGSIQDLCAMVDEAARALIPGPVATTALATLVVDDPDLLDGLASGRLTAGAALRADLRDEDGRVSGTVDYVLGADTAGLLLLPVGDHVVVVDAAADGVTVELLGATDFSRPLGKVTLTSAPATRLAASRRRFEDLAATVLAAEAAGVAQWALDTATEYAKVREQFGKPIGSFQAIKHMCAEMLLRSQQAGVAGRGRGDRRRVAVAGPAAPVADGATSWRSRPRSPPPSESAQPRPTPRTASRSSAASASPGSTTRISTCAAPTDRAVPQRPLGLAAPRRRADSRRGAARAARRPRVGGTPTARNRRGRRRCRGTARREATGRDGRQRSAGTALAQAVRPRSLAGRAAAHRPGAGGRRGRTPRSGDRVVGCTDDPGRRNAGADRALRARHPERRADLVPVVQRAGRRFRPRRAAHESCSGRGRLAAHRPEGVELGRAEGALRGLPGQN